MKAIYVQWIADRLQVKPWQVDNCEKLFQEGATIPFISRYRKERTGGLDDAAVAEIRHWSDVFAEMEKRKASVLETISAAGKLTPELQQSIERCTSATVLEDIYLPFRPKRRTRATVAKEAGLEPLADCLMEMRVADPEAEAARYTGDKVPHVEAALAGARDIIAERISETAAAREGLRRVFRTRRIVSKATKAAGEHPAEASKYKAYFNFSTPIGRIPAHNLLAMLRAEAEGYLSIRLDADADRCGAKLYYDLCQGRPRPSRGVEAQLRMAADDAYKRLMEPSITNEVIKEAKQKADAASIDIFDENLRQLLLAPPLGQVRTLAVDPGFRNGCKTACLDETGNLLHHEIIYPHPPQSEKVKSISALSRMISEYGIQAIAIGNGTASRETEAFIRRVPLPAGCRIFVVSEDGASIYSASEVARKEFPDEDVTVRGAVSIGRRLMDPLAELVKIDPKSLGVGQYQHDVDQVLLRERLDRTVEHCVNLVGVNLNTASEYLLSYVAGIGPALAANIVAYRRKIKRFRSREQLLEVPRLGAKAFQQCAGFLRVKDGDNPLDNSAVHPESYSIVDRMAADLGVTAAQLVGREDLIARIDASRYVSGEVGLPTLNDILKELAKPGLDPREKAEEFSFSEEIHSIEDLKAGMELPGIVTNLTAFGAFVDVGVHENGLIHATRMGVRGMAVPSRVLKLHQAVRVRVLDVDLDRARISLELLKPADKK